MNESHLHITIQKFIQANSNDLAFDFFIIFSRFEFALKARGYMRDSSGGVIVDWNKFAEDVDGDIMQSEDSQFISALNYIKGNPPKKQMIEDGKLSWKTDNSIEDFTFNRLLVLLRRIRNNLFHGGKFIKGYEEDISRDEQLLKSGIIIIQTCLLVNKKLMDYFMLK